MINMVNKYAKQLGIVQAIASSDYAETYLIEDEMYYYEKDAIEMIQDLYYLLYSLVQYDPDDNILYKDYMIVEDYLELYDALNN